MEKIKSIGIIVVNAMGYSIAIGLAFGALAVVAGAFSFANTSGYPPWSMKEVFTTVSIIAFVITFIALSAD